MHLFCVSWIGCSCRLQGVAKVANVGGGRLSASSAAEASAIASQRSDATVLCSLVLYTLAAYSGRARRSPSKFTITLQTVAMMFIEFSD